MRPAPPPRARCHIWEEARGGERECLWMQGRSRGWRRWGVARRKGCRDGDGWGGGAGASRPGIFLKSLFFASIQLLAVGRAVLGLSSANPGC